MSPRRVVPLALLATLAASAPARAVTTVGSSLPEPTGVATCDAGGGDCTVLVEALNFQSTAVPHFPSPTFPARAVIVRWRVREASGAFRLRVIRREPAGRRVVASSPQVSVDAGGVQTFETRVPVVERDEIALDMLGGSLGYREHPAPPPGGNPEVQERFWMPPLEDGEIVRPPDQTSFTVEDLYNYDVEADADADGFGDETQDACPRDAALQTACSADLAASISGPAVVPFGTLATMTFEVKNNGTSPADNVLLTVTLPRALAGNGTCLGGGPGPGSIPPVGFIGCKKVGDKLLGSFPSVRAGASVSARLIFRAFADGPLVTPMTVTSATVDPNGANNSATRSIGVVLKRGACANSQSGTPAADVLVGTKAGDRLRGFGGNDTLRGGAGADCLIGGPGRDKLFGGTGKDNLSARDGKPDLVDCGPGKDVAKVDAKDKVKGCEKT